MKRRLFLHGVFGATAALAFPFLPLYAKARGRDVVVRAGEALVVKTGDVYGKIVVDGGTVTAEERGAVIDEIVCVKGDVRADWSETLHLEVHDDVLSVRAEPVVRKRLSTGDPLAVTVPGMN